MIRDCSALHTLQFQLHQRCLPPIAVYLLDRAVLRVVFFFFLASDIPFCNEFLLCCFQFAFAVATHRRSKIVGQLK